MITSSFYLCNSAALETGLSRSAFTVYSFLAVSANRITRDSYYKRQNIAALCHISESTVVRAVRELCKRGLLEIKRRYCNGRQTSNRYILLDNPQLKLSEVTETSVGASGKTFLFRCNPAAFRANLPASALKVYSYLSLRADKSGECLPSQKEIAADCSISVSTVFRSLKVLRQAGLLEIQPQTRLDTCGTNGKSVNRYRLEQKETPAGYSTGKMPPPQKPLPESSKIPQTSEMTPLPFYRPAIGDRFRALAKPEPKHLFSLPFLTPSLRSLVTPLRTSSRKKDTLKQRKKSLLLFSTRVNIVNILASLSEHRKNSTREVRPPDTG